MEGTAERSSQGSGQVINGLALLTGICDQRTTTSALAGEQDECSVVCGQLDKKDN
jgi:hypothetical protein